MTISDIIHGNNSYQRVPLGSPSRSTNDRKVQFELTPTSQTSNGSAACPISNGSANSKMNIQRFFKRKKKDNDDGFIMDYTSIFTYEANARGLGNGRQPPAGVDLQQKSCDYWKSAPKPTRTTDVSMRRTCFTYLCQPRIEAPDGYLVDSVDDDHASRLQSGLEMFLLSLAYLIVGIFAPFTLWFVMKSVDTTERMVVFRFGRLQKPRGPGLVAVLPIVERSHRVDMRTKIIEIEPIQALTDDGGIVSTGAAVTYRIRDAVLCVSNVAADVDNSIRELTRSSVHRAVNRSQADDMMEDASAVERHLMTELSELTFDWGLEIKEMKLKSTTLLKEPKNRALRVFESLMPHINSVAQQCGPEAQAAASALAGLVPNSGADGAGVAVPPGTSNGFPTGPIAEVPQQPQQGSSVASIDRVVEVVRTALDENVVMETQCVYEFEVTDLAHIVRADLRHGRGSVTTVDTLSSDAVRLRLDSCTLQAILRDELNPVVAMMQQRVLVSGDVHAVAKLRCLADKVKKNMADNRVAVTA